MKGLKETLVNLSSLRGRFDRLLTAAAKRAAPVTPVKARHLREVAGFGSNPGNLRMLTHMRRNLPAAPALVVALHGCTQTAAEYDYGSGWSKLAYTHGFALLFPEQKRSNNPNNCFNWFLPSDAKRGAGEALSIYQMIERMIEEHGIDRRRVFIVGLSAGGAMASAMLATYPDVFAGGAVIAGLPYGCATNVQDALQTMAQGRGHSAEEWGDLVRSASSHRGPWPKLSLWHGSSDAIVNPRNMEEALKQWVHVHGVSARPRVEHEVAGHSRRVWRTDDGDDVIEALTIRGMNHGVPIATTGRDGFGNVGPFHFDVGISSSQHIASFWGIAEKRPAVEEQTADKVNTAVERTGLQAAASLAAREGASTADAGSRAGVGIWHDPRMHITAALKAAGLLSDHPVDSNPLDPRSVITRTLRSVGLLKE